MSLRSSCVGVRNHTWRPMRPGRVSAGSSSVSGMLVAPMKKTCSGEGFGRLSRSDTLPTRCGTKYMASSQVLILLVKMRLKKGGSSTPSICTSSWLSAKPPPPPPKNGR